MGRDFIIEKGFLWLLKQLPQSESILTLNSVLGYREDGPLLREVGSPSVPSYKTTEEDGLLRKSCANFPSSARLRFMMPSLIIMTIGLRLIGKSLN